MSAGCCRRRSAALMNAFLPFADGGGLQPGPGDAVRRTAAWSPVRPRCSRCSGGVGLSWARRGRRRSCRSRAGADGRLGVQAQGECASGQRDDERHHAGCGRVRTVARSDRRTGEPRHRQRQALQLRRDTAMSFHEVRFPAALELRFAVGGPMRRTEVVTLANGHEERNTPWAHSRRQLRRRGSRCRRSDDLDTVLIAFFEARRGQLHGFRWKDWADYKSSQPSADVVCATDQSARLRRWQRGRVPAGQDLCLRRSPATTRPIQKPVTGSVLVNVGGVAQQAEGTDFTLDSRRPGVHHLCYLRRATVVEVTAGYEFDVAGAVRHVDQLQIVCWPRSKPGNVPNVSRSWSFGSDAGCRPTFRRPSGLRCTPPSHAAGR